MIRSDGSALESNLWPELEKAARRAYELGRAQGALWRAALVALLALPAYRSCNSSPLAALCLGGLVLSVAAGRYRGADWERGSRAGAIAGVAPCLLPALMQTVDPAYCARMMAGGVPWPCIFGGLAAGFALGFQVGLAPGERGRWPFWTSAVAALSLAAALGCLPAGAIGFAGLLAGIVAGGAPALVLRRAIG
jgi:hypothetical protein